jgi:DnaJ-class molecular chaperone
MIVTTEAISKVPVCENACSRCNGVGKVWTIPYSTNHEAWQSECDSCFGEKVMTVELLERHSKKQTGRLRPPALGSEVVRTAE